jgi:hypothetical protein
MWFLIDLALRLRRVDVIILSEPLVDNVRFGSEADISAYVTDVCFTPKSGHFGTPFPIPLLTIIAQRRQELILI